MEQQKGDEIIRQRLVGKLVQVIVNNKYFYHGRLVDYNDQDIIIDDVKNGVMPISRSHKAYIVRPMTPEQQLRLATKLDTIGGGATMTLGDKFVRELKEHQEAVAAWQEANREKLFGKKSDGK